MGKKKAAWPLAVGCALAAATLLFCSASVGAGIRRGLSICASVMIPSLFPFLILSDFVARTRMGRLLEGPLGGAARRIYGAPRELAPAILMSWIGGYPAGARVLAGMVERGALSPEDADSALTFCVNSGPAFLVAVVGAGVFGSPWWGLFLFACQLLAGAVTGRILCRGRRIRVRPRGKDGWEDAAPGFVQAVSSATGGMLSICAFVLVFSALTQVLEDFGALGVLGNLICRVTRGGLSPDGAALLGAGLLEIGGGCARAQALAPGQGALVLPFLLSFSSVSVVCQVAACFRTAPANMGLLVRSRILHGCLTALFASPALYRRFAFVSALTGQPVLAPGSGTLLGGLCLMCMCAILCSAVEGSPR